MVEPRPAVAGAWALRRRAAWPAALAGLAGLVLCAAAARADERPTVRGETVRGETVRAETAEGGTARGETGAGEITLELIMSDPDWIGNAPEDPYWADDGRAVFFSQKRVGEEHRDLIRIDLSTGERRVVADAERGAVDAPGGKHSRDRRSKVFAREGDVYVKDLGSGAITQLTRTATDETDPFFMADGRVAFRRGDDLFVRDLATGLEVQAADVRLEKAPDAEEEEEEGFLPAQQLRLFDVLRERKREREAGRERAEREQAADPTRPPLPFYLGDGVEIRQRALSPAGDALALVVADTPRDPGRKDQMPDWVTESGYVETREVRAKVGTGDGSGERLVLLDLAAHERHDLDLSALPGIADDPLAELKKAAEARRQEERAAAGKDDPGNGDTDEDGEDGEDGDAGSKPRAVIFEEPIAWSPDGRTLAVQAHSVDNKDRWIALVDAGEKTLRPIHRLSHEAWINWFFNDFGWLSDGRRLYFLSEESGFSQLYLYTLDDGTTRRLTGGDGVVSDVALSPDEELFLFTANPDHPGVYETYRVPVAGGPVEQLTRLGGKSSSILSPDGGSLLVTHSATTRPPELFVQPARPGAEARQVTHTTSERFASLPWVAPEIVAVPSSHHDRPITSRYYPPQADLPHAQRPGAGRPDAGRPAVVFVHGAGYLQNAHHGWSGYFREFMFHTLLTRHGYAVLDMDYRASAGYGAAWRTAIYRRMGTPELEDLSDGVAWLAAERGVDPARVGVYGGSYGGFMALMALFTAPDLFACGAALRPVTDWAHYNHSYTSNILNTPEIDPEAYRRSSPIEHAAGLEKPLLICAPMQDDNVFFSDTVRLVQRLIELEKQDWEVAIYPVEPHGFKEPASWLDEYRRIFKLFETHLKR